MVLNSHTISTLGALAIAANFYGLLAWFTWSYGWALAMFALSAIVLAPLAPAVATHGLPGWIIIVLMLIYHIGGIHACAWRLLHKN